MTLNNDLENQVWYKYKNKEISTPASEGYLTDFQKTKDWIEWLKKEFEISEDDFKKEQFKIQFKSKNQSEYIKLFYTIDESIKKGWISSKEGELEIGWPPIYLHPLIEDYLPSNCECGHKTYFNIRSMKEDFKYNKQKNHTNEESDYRRWSNRTLMVRCGSCGKVGGMDRDCVYRVCEKHMGEGRHFWIDAWNKLGVRV